MARHTQAREIAELKGALAKHPERYRNKPPKSIMPIGNAPDHMDEMAKKCWFEIQSLAIPGVLTGSDRIALEMYANLLAEYRENPRKFSAAKMTQMRGINAELGMSPSSRAKLGVKDDKDDEDDFESL